MKTVGDNYLQDKSVKYLRFMVFNTTFNNISGQVFK